MQRKGDFKSAQNWRWSRGKEHGSVHAPTKCHKISVIQMGPVSPRVEADDEVEQDDHDSEKRSLSDAEEQRGEGEDLSIDEHGRDGEITDGPSQDDSYELLGAENHNLRPQHARNRCLETFCSTPCKCKAMHLRWTRIMMIFLHLTELRRCVYRCWFRSTVIASTATCGSRSSAICAGSSREGSECASTDWRHYGWDGNTFHPDTATARRTQRVG